MSPKKPNRSPFGLFMMKMKIEDKSLANKPMDQMVNYCNKIYVKLDPEVKKKFSKLSQFVRNNNCNDIDIITYLKQIQNNNNDNYFELNTGFTKLRERPQELIQSSDEETHNDLIVSYERVFNAIKSHEDFKNLSFIVISFNVSLQTFDGVYYPNEIGLTKFSLKDGIQQTYHKLIYNRIPQGFQWTAQEFADRTHKLPLNPIDQSFETNYESLFDDIFDFMSSTHLIDSKGKKLVFCKPIDSDGHESRPQIVGCLKWIANKMNKSDKSFANFEIIDLSELLYVMTKPLTNRPKSLFTDDLSKSGYDYSQHISCDFHEQKQNKYCALGMTKRLCYLFFDSFFEYNKDSDLKPTVNHKPVEQKYEFIEMPTFKFRDIKTNPMRREERFYSNANNYENRKLANTSNPTNTSIGIKSNRDFRKPYSAGIGRGKIGANVKKFN